MGKLILEFMNGFGHKDLANWAFDFFEIKDGDSILDIGCGGGGNISRMLRLFPNSIIYGVDYSLTSVATSKKKNFIGIENNRCQIILGNVNNLPFDACSFSSATAFETIYYWPSIERSLKEVHRILKQDGIFIIVNGADAEGGWTWDNYIEGMHTYTPIELEKHLINAGFQEVKVYRKREYNFLCVIAYK